MGVYCITCKNKECANYGRSLYFDWSCEKYFNNGYTNADHIRQLSDKNLAEFLWQFDKEEIARENEYFLTLRKLLEWLQSPCKETNMKED